MKRLGILTLGWLLVAGLVTAQAQEGKTAGKKGKKVLKVGDQAPEFKLKGSDGNTYKLSDFKGKSAVVVAWYPKALTGG